MWWIACVLCHSNKQKDRTREGSAPGATVTLVEWLYLWSNVSKLHQPWLPSLVTFQLPDSFLNPCTSLLFSRLTEAKAVRVV